MPEYRYHRMTDNTFGWKRPHTGRLGFGSGYVSQQGFGHEDWNFAREVWDDGRHHLYLTVKPKQQNIKEDFNIVLGVHTKQGAMVAGFAENVEYSESNLPVASWRRRAQEIHALDASGQLGERYKGKRVPQIAKELIEEKGIYSVSVSPSNLHILEQPIFIPSEVYTVATPLYRLLPMTEDQYKSLRDFAMVSDLSKAADLDDDTSFAEGAQVEKLHRSRERNRQLVKKAKDAFLKLHGTLHCEACGMEPSVKFKDPSLATRIIEAHHNVSISDPAHTGETRVEDLSMLCPSCHRAIHTIRPWLSVKELRSRLDDSNG